MNNLNYTVNREVINEELYNKAYQYAMENNISVDELLLSIIKLEDTGLFNNKGGQSTVFNRLTDNNIRTLKQLFDKQNIQYGTNKMGDNYYIYDEINGIIRLIKYKYVDIYPEELKELLEFKINTYPNITITSHDFGYPGKVFNTLIRSKNTKHLAYQYVNELYKTLKSCGFDQSSSKALMDIAYSKKVNDITLGQFLSSLDLEEVRQVFLKVPQEYPVFINILNILVHYYNTETKNNSRKRN